MSPRRFMLTGIVLPGVLTAVGLVVMWFGLVAWEDAKATEGWLPVPGEITGLELRERRQARSFGRSGWSPWIRYTYRWEGGIVSSTRYELLPPAMVRSKEEAEALLSDYVEGQQVTVFREPAPGDRSVLKRGSSGFPLAMAGMGVLLGSLGLALALGARRKRRELLTAAQSESGDPAP